MAMVVAVFVLHRLALAYIGGVRTGITGLGILGEIFRQSSGRFIFFIHLDFRQTICV